MAMNEADRSIAAACLVLAFLRESFDQLFSGKRYAQQGSLSSDSGEIARRQVVQLVQLHAALCFLRAADFLGVCKKQPPTLFRLQVVKFELERETAE